MNLQICGVQLEAWAYVVSHEPRRTSYAHVRLAHKLLRVMSSSMCDDKLRQCREMQRVAHSDAVLREARRFQRNVVSPSASEHEGMKRGQSAFEPRPSARASPAFTARNQLSDHAKPHWISP